MRLHGRLDYREHHLENGVVTQVAFRLQNLYNFLDILVDKKTKALAVNWDDEIVKATALTRDGAVVHPNFQPKSAA